MQLEDYFILAERKTAEYQVHASVPVNSMTRLAISLPDYVSQTAERYARKMGVSPDAFYAAAVAFYVRELQKDDVTLALDQVYAEESSAVDPILQQLQFNSLEPEDWLLRGEIW